MGLTSYQATAGLAGPQRGALPAPCHTTAAGRGGPWDQGQKVCPDGVQVPSRKERGPLHSSANQIPNCALQKRPLRVLLGEKVQDLRGKSW